MTVELRRERIPFVGINWWPLFDTIQWDYREKFVQPVKDFIYPGGWNNGLCTIDVRSDGRFNRVWTPAAAACKAVIARDLK